MLTAHGGSVACLLVSEDNGPSLQYQMKDSFSTCKADHKEDRGRGSRCVTLWRC